MIKLSVETKHVFNDLQILQKQDINAYGRAAALIQELHANQGLQTGQDLIDQLNIQGRNFKVAPSVNGNSLKIEHEKLHRDLWRLKLWIVDKTGKRHLEPYRIIYGFFTASQFRKNPEVRIFAVPYRGNISEDSYDYQHDHPISVRVRSAYDSYI